MKEVPAWQSFYAGVIDRQGEPHQLQMSGPGLTKQQAKRFVRLAHRDARAVVVVESPFNAMDHGNEAPRA